MKLQLKDKLSPSAKSVNASLSWEAVSSSTLFLFTQIAKFHVIPVIQVGIRIEKNYYSIITRFYLKPTLFCICVWFFIVSFFFLLLSTSYQANPVLFSGLGSPCGLGPRSPVWAALHIHRREHGRVPCRLPTSLCVAHWTAQGFGGLSQALSVPDVVGAGFVWTSWGRWCLWHLSLILCSWGFLPFFHSGSLFGSLCPVFALATFFNKPSPTEKLFVIIMGSRKQFPCLSENTAWKVMVSGYGAGMLPVILHYKCYVSVCDI